jgi:modulator of FtsH protease
MHPYSSDFWADFALGQLGASAALLGLVFVGISININVIMKAPPLVDRACESVILLGFVLLTATAVLIPGQDRHAAGVELLVVGIIVALAVLRTLRSSGASLVQGRQILIRRVLSLGAPLLAIVAGLSLLANAGGGFGWWVGAVVTAYVAALTGAWVLLVEILR